MPPRSLWRPGWDRVTTERRHGRLPAGGLATSGRRGARRSLPSSACPLPKPQPVLNPHSPPTLLPRLATAAGPAVPAWNPSLMRLRNRGTALVLVAAGMLGIGAGYSLPLVSAFVDSNARSAPLSDLSIPSFAFPTFGKDASAAHHARTHAKTAAAASAAHRHANIGGGTGGVARTAGGTAGAAARLLRDPGSQALSQTRGASTAATQQGQRTRTVTHSAPNGQSTPGTQHVPAGSQPQIVENSFSVERLPSAGPKKDPFAGVPMVDETIGAPAPSMSDPSSLAQQQPAYDPLAVVHPLPPEFAKPPADQGQANGNGQATAPGQNKTDAIPGVGDQPQAGGNGNTGADNGNRNTGADNPANGNAYGKPLDKATGALNAHAVKAVLKAAAAPPKR